MTDHKNSEKRTEQVKNMDLSDYMFAVIDWIKYFLGKWWLFAIVVLAFGALGAWIAYKEKAKYQARLTFALDDNGAGGLGGALSLAADFGINIGSGKDAFSGENITKILTSQRIIKRVLLSTDTFNGKPMTLATEFIKISDWEKKIFSDARLSKISFPLGLQKEQLNYLQDSILFNIYTAISEKNLTAGKQDKKLDVFEVKFTSMNERFSKIFIEKLIKETIAFYTELRSRHSKNTLDVLEARVATLKGSVNSSISQRLTTQDANLNPAFAAAQVPTLQKEVDIRVYGGAYAELFKNLEVARIQYLKDIPLLQIIDAPDYPMKKIKSGRLMSALQFAAPSVVLLMIILFLRRIMIRKRKAIPGQERPNS